jgi:hypothetical protein
VKKRSDRRFTSPALQRIGISADPSAEVERDLPMVESDYPATPVKVAALW